MYRKFTAILPVLLFLIISTACTQPAATNNSSVQDRAQSDRKTEAPIGGGQGDIEAQKSPNANVVNSVGTCKLTKAPIIDGFELGQTVKEVSNKVPGFEEAYNKEKSGAIESNKKINFTLVTSGSLPRGNSFEKENPSKSYIWHFLDDKLMGLVVKDLDTDESDAKVYVNTLAKANGLPADGWKFEQDGSADLSCVNFDVMITSGGQPGNGIMITDKAAFKIKEDRIKDNQ